MTYSEMLSGIIEESQLSLRVISNRCAQQNLSITPSYISQLKNGKLPPPTEEVSLVLAKVCGAKDPAALVFQGYLEKAPGIVKEYMLASSSLNRLMLQTLTKVAPQAVSKDLIDYIENMDILSTLEMASEYVDPEKGLQVNGLIEEISRRSGVATQADTKGELQSFMLADASMEPMIPQHALVYVLPTRRNLLKDRDIVAFNLPGRKVVTLRRFFQVGDEILLIPDNRLLPIYRLTELDQIEYLGKVVSFRADI